MKIEYSDLSSEERNQFENEVDGDNAGCGIILTGKYHVLTYRPIKENGKCVGVATILNKMESEGSTIVRRNEVHYKLPWYCKQTSFKSRLDAVVKEQVSLVPKLDKAIDDEIARVIKEKADREKAVKEYTEKVRSCRLKIDSTIKTIVPEAKSLIEYNSDRLLAEKINEHTPVSDIDVTETFFDPPEKKVEPIRFGGSNQEHNRLVNDMMINSRGNKMYKSTCPKRFPTAELVLPGDKKYLTTLEKQQRINADW